MITGAASGIGAACARKFASEGANLIIVDIDESKAREVAKEVNGVAITCDLNDPTAISSMVAEVEGTIGPVDLLFNNAGIASGRGPLDTDLEEWQTTMERESYVTCSRRSRCSSRHARAWRRLHFYTLLQWPASCRHTIIYHTL